MSNQYFYCVLYFNSKVEKQFLCESNKSNTLYFIEGEKWKIIFLIFVDKIDNINPHNSSIWSKNIFRELINIGTRIIINETLGLSFRCVYLLQIHPTKYLSLRLTIFETHFK